MRAFWEEGRVDEAVEAVRDMEQRGVVGAASVYYELACCLCNNGRWQDAMLEVSIFSLAADHFALDFSLLVFDVEPCLYPGLVLFYFFMLSPLMCEILCYIHSLEKMNF